MSRAITIEVVRARHGAEVGAQLNVEAADDIADVLPADLSAVIDHDGNVWLGHVHPINSTRFRLIRWGGRSLVFEKRHIATVGKIVLATLLACVLSNCPVIAAWVERVPEHVAEAVEERLEDMLPSVFPDDDR